MPRITTNLLKELTEFEKEEIRKTGKEFGEIELGEHVQKNLNLKETVKFVLDGFLLKKLLGNVSLWNLFESLLQKLFLIARNKNGAPLEIQFWIRDTSNPAALNIAFGAREEDEFKDRIISLKNKLITDIFSTHRELEKNKIIWIGFDEENNLWSIQFL